MFTKATKTPAPTTAQTRKTVVASLLAEGMAIRGDIAADGDLHLDGSVEGDVTVGRLTLGESGSVAGTIRAESVEVRGRVVGAIFARQVRLCATAHVEGEISHSELAIEAGARFEGRSLVFAESAPAEPLALTSAAE